MKSSNKLLLCGAGVALLIPIFMFFSFKKSIEEKKYHLVKDSEMIPEKISIGQPKVLKIWARQYSFSCTIRSSATPSYHTYNINDRTRVWTSGDTLLVSFGAPKVDNANSNISFAGHIDIDLPQIPIIVAEGAAVVMGDINRDTNSFLDVRLFNGAKLELGTLSGQSKKILTVIGGRNDVAKSRIDCQTLLFDRLKVTAVNSELEVGPYAGIRSLDVALKGNSRISFAPTSVIGQLKGSISDKSLFTAGNMHFFLRDSLRIVPDENAKISAE